jgi:hypothetical protein
MRNICNVMDNIWNMMKIDPLIARNFKWVVGCSRRAKRSEVRSKNTRPRPGQRLACRRNAVATKSCGLDSVMGLNSR